MVGVILELSWYTGGHKDKLGGGGGGGEGMPPGKKLILGENIVHSL